MIGALSAGTVFEQTLALGSTHRYVVDLASGGALRLEVDQQHVDVALELTAPDGSRLRVDSPTERGAPEALCWVSEIAGSHTINIVPFAGAGRYTLRVVALSPATVRDRDCVEAQSTFLAATEFSKPRRRADQFDRAAERFTAAQEPLRAAVAWREAGTTLYRADHPAEAIHRFDRALILARQVGSDYLESSLLNRLGLAYRAIDDLERARTTFCAARDHAIATDDFEALAAAWTNLGALLPSLGDPHSALDALREAISLWQKLGDRGQEAQAHIHRGDALGLLDRHHEAADAYSEALELAREIHDVRRMAFALQGRGWSLYLQGQAEEAREFLDRALDFFDDSDTTATIGLIDRWATVRAAMGDFDGALRVRRELLDRIDAESDPRNRAGALLNLGCLLTTAGQLAEARGRIDESAEFFDQSSDLSVRAHLAFCRARLASREGLPNAAIEQADLALTLLDRLRDNARADGHRFRPLRLWREYADLASSCPKKAEARDLRATFASLAESPVVGRREKEAQNNGPERSTARTDGKSPLRGAPLPFPPGEGKIAG